MAVSQRRIEANRRNAMRSTGPRTAEGKARSRANAMSHGLAAEVLVPEGERREYEVALARWEREAGPDNVAEEQLIRRAAVASVRLSRIERAGEQAREQAAREAVGAWERRKMAAARRVGRGMEQDPAGTAAELEGSAFGCDWLIRQWRMLGAPLEIGRGWDRRGLDRAQQMLGFVEGRPEADAAPAVRQLWLLAGAASPSEVEAIPRLGAEAGLPADPAGARAALRALVAAEVERLEALRAERWEEVDRRECAAVAARAASADVSREGQLRHRYEVAADRSCNAALRLFLNVRDRRRRELLAIAKEAAAINTTPRAPVGGGWWREADSDPAPPGFSRVVPAPDPTPEPMAPGSATVPEPASPAPPPPKADNPPADPPGIVDAAPPAAAQNEPNEAASPADQGESKPLSTHDFRRHNRDLTTDAPRRTGPRPMPSSAASAVGSAQPGPPTASPDTASVVLPDRWEAIGSDRPPLAVGSPLPLVPHGGDRGEA